MKLHHLALRSPDPERCARFYTAILAVPERSRHRHPDGSVRSIWLGADEPVIMIEARASTEPPVPTGSLELLAFALGSRTLDEARAELLAHGVAVEASTEFTLYFRDPDGRRVGLSRYVFPTG